MINIVNNNTFLFIEFKQQKILKISTLYSQNYKERFNACAAM